MDAKKLIDLCRDKTVWIQTHNFPDPDAISSGFALQGLLKRFGIESLLCHDGAIDKISSLKMLKLIGAKIYPKSEIESRMKKEDMIILVDCQKNNGNTTDFIGDELAVIDHHPTFKKVNYEYADLRITGSCAAIITEYFKELNIVPTVKEATGLLYGMRMDTLQFSRGMAQFDVDMYAYIFRYTDSTLLKELETNNMEFNDLQGYSVAIDNIRTYGKIGFSHLDFEFPDALVAILSDFLLSLAEVEVVVLYAKRDDGFKFSVRSERGDIHAGNLANEALKDIGNGGGHASMAGGFVSEENIKDKDYFYEQVQERFLEAIKTLCPNNNIL